ncbi:Polyprenyl transferase mapA [Frankliniella fusca]|uniref:Polyprenyl transferase mapA n=1 Tax=Frankliniella fusca TaxID=407009 RepID=A0AAE1H857_9NEOP|nr:Polyprenyl transferase mapA [Frankliniella fusca]
MLGSDAAVISSWICLACFKSSFKFVNCSAWITSSSMSLNSTPVSLPLIRYDSGRIHSRGSTLAQQTSCSCIVDTMGTLDFNNCIISSPGTHADPSTRYVLHQNLNLMEHSELSGHLPEALQVQLEEACGQQ